MKSLYENPIIYDILHGGGTAREVSGLERLARRYADPDRSRPAGQGRGAWLEPACGTARHLRVAAARGYPVTGFDRSPALVAYACRRFERAGLERRLFVADMEDFHHHLAPASIAFAFNLDNTIRHLENDAALLSHLDCVARVLEPDGIYAVGLSLSRPGEAISEDFWTGRRGGCRVDHLVQYIPWEGERSEVLIHHLSITRNGRTDHFDFQDRLRTYSGEQWEALLERAGWKRLAVVDAAGEAIEPGIFDYGIHVLAPTTRRTAVGSGWPT